MVKKSSEENATTKRISGSVDTNVLLRYVLHDVPGQSRDIDAMIAGGASFVVEDAALLEMMYVLEKVFEMERDVVCDNMYAVIRNGAFVSSVGFFEKVLALYVAEQKLSIIDCALLEYARASRALPLKTFDKDIIKRSKGDASAPGV